MSAGTATKDAAAKLLGLTSTASNNVTEPTLTSGTASENTTGSVATYQIVIKGKAAGKIQVGPTNAAGSYEIPVEQPASTQSAVELRVPAGWFVKPTLTEGTIVKTIVQTI
jgi:hypothetical protein